MLSELVEHGLDGGLARSLVTDLVEVDEVLEPRFLEVTLLQILGNLLGWVLPGLPLRLPLYCLNINININIRVGGCLP